MYNRSREGSAWSVQCSYRMFPKELVLQELHEKILDPSCYYVAPTHVNLPLLVINSLLICHSH